MKTYRKKPVEIKAVKLENTEESILEAISFLGFGILASEQAKELVLETARHNEGIYIVTLEGRMKADFGDYIIKGVKNEFYPCKPDVFEMTYEEVEE
jgi:hypothetical protein